MAATPKRRGRPPVADAMIVRGIRLRPSTIAAMNDDARSPDEIMRAGLTVDHSISPNST